LRQFLTSRNSRPRQKGRCAAQSGLGLVYGNGQGVPVDYGEAMKWYRKAADQGNANAQNNLGAYSVIVNAPFGAS